MAFILRKKIMGLKKVANAGLSEDSSKKQPKYIVPDEKSFKEQAIKVLNILESRGINIYDENRTPGMYLNRDVKTSNSKKITEFLGGLSEQNNQHQQPTEKLEISSNIFNFLTNIKK